MVLCNVPFDSGELVSVKKRLKVHTSQTASFSSTIAEECIALLRKLHPLPAWNDAINDFIGSALQNIPQLVLHSQFIAQECLESQSSHAEQV